MPEKTKEKEDLEKRGEVEKTLAEDCEIDPKDNWSKDQREKSYYYDDSHGYEIYNPDEDDDE